MHPASGRRPSHRRLEGKPVAPDPDLELTEMSDEECQTLSEHCVGRLGIIATTNPSSSR